LTIEQEKAAIGRPGPVIVASSGINIIRSVDSRIGRSIQKTFHQASPTQPLFAPAWFFAAFGFAGRIS